jgi:hypothetical protein
MRDVPYPTYEGGGDENEEDAFYDAFYSRIGRSSNRNAFDALKGLAKVAITHGLEVVHYDDGGGGDYIFDIVKAGEPACCTTLEEELPRDGELRKVKFPHMDDGDDQDNFYDSIGRSDYDQPYDLLQSADRLLEKFGLEIICYAGSSDLDFEIDKRQAKPAPQKRMRGPEFVDILAGAGLDPALAAVIDPKPEPQSDDEIRRQRRHATQMLKRFVPNEEPAVMGTEMLTLEEVVELLKDKSIIGDERKALHQRLDAIVLA